MGNHDERKEKKQPTFFELLDRIATALENIQDILSDSE